MMKNRTSVVWTISVVSLLLAGGCRHAAPPGVSQFDPNYTAWNTLLARQVNAQGGVDYTGIKQRPELLETALAEFRAVGHAEFETWTGRRRLAFLANAHNAFAIRRVVNHYPVPTLEKTRWVGSARDACDIRLLGRRWSLRQLAEEAMGDRYLDTRAIFLLNWAQIGCAPLPPVAVTERNIEDLMERQTQRFLADPVRCRYETRTRTIYLSPLLREYREQLRRDYTTIWVFLARYLPKGQASELRNIPPRIRWLDNDRSLNDANLRPVAVEPVGQ